MKLEPTEVVSASASSPPLIEPDGRISRIRLSMVVHRRRYRSRPLRATAQCSLKRSNCCCRCYLPEGSHRTVLLSAVHIDQLRPLRSGPVTSLRRYYGPLRLLPRPNEPRGFTACVRRWTSPPTGGDLIPCCQHPSRHSALADPAAALTGQAVIQASPVLHRVCLGPALAAFAVSVAARLCDLAHFGAHPMRFTFVADCLFG